VEKLEGTAKPERIAGPHRDSNGLLHLALGCLPFEEAVDRKDAAAPAIGITEGRQFRQFVRGYFLLPPRNE
jgi:hypothetical protein